MVKESPLDNPDNAAFAWARFRRILRYMALLTLGVVGLGLGVLYCFSSTAVSIHYYIAAALGFGLTMLMASVLMGLVFLSSGTGHDDAIEDPFAED